MDNQEVKLKEEIRNQTIGYITAAFGLVAGLAWNEAIKSLIEFLFPLASGGVLAKFVYAVVITVMLVFITFHLRKILKK